MLSEYLHRSPNTNLVGLTALVSCPKNNALSPVPRLTPAAAQATADAHGCASPGAAGGTQRPRSRTKICYVLLSYCVSCFVIFVIRYPRTKTISREDAHPIYQRYPRVFSFMSWFTAHSPTNLCEKGWGYHCCVLVRLLALSAKLNWFLPKKMLSDQLL